jgi:hypothetical protein
MEGVDDSAYKDQRLFFWMCRAQTLIYTFEKNLSL